MFKTCKIIFAKMLKMNGDLLNKLGALEYIANIEGHKTQ